MPEEYHRDKDPSCDGSRRSTGSKNAVGEQPGDLKSRRAPKQRAHFNRDGLGSYRTCGHFDWRCCGVVFSDFELRTYMV